MLVCKSLVFNLTRNHNTSLALQPPHPAKTKNLSHRSVVNVFLSFSSSERLSKMSLIALKASSRSKQKLRTYDNRLIYINNSVDLQHNKRKEELDQHNHSLYIE